MFCGSITITSISSASTILSGVPPEYIDSGHRLYIQAFPNAYQTFMDKGYHAYRVDADRTSDSSGNDMIAIDIRTDSSWAVGIDQMLIGALFLGGYSTPVAIPIAAASVSSKGLIPCANSLSDCIVSADGYEWAFNPPKNNEWMRVGFYPAEICEVTGDGPSFCDGDSGVDDPTESSWRLLDIHVAFGVVDKSFSKSEFDSPPWSNIDFDESDNASASPVASTDPSASPSTSPTPTPSSDKAESQALKIYLVQGNPSFECVSSSEFSRHMQPGDERVYVDFSVFRGKSSEAGAPLDMWIAVGSEHGEPKLDRNYHNYEILGGAYDSEPQGIIRGFRNISQKDSPSYHLGVMLRDRAGVVYSPQCSYGPIQTAPIKNLLVSDNCFVATYAYGSIDSWQVHLLRKFRDKILLKTNWGFNFSAWYYAWSPEFVFYLKPYPKLRFVFQFLLLPILFLAEISILIASILGPTQSVIAALFLFFCLIGTLGFLVYKKKGKIVPLLIILLLLAPELSKASFIEKVKKDSGFKKAENKSLVEPHKKSLAKRKKKKGKRKKLKKKKPTKNFIESKKTKLKKKKVSLINSIPKKQEKSFLKNKIVSSKKPDISFIMGQQKKIKPETTEYIKELQKFVPLADPSDHFTENVQKSIDKKNTISVFDNVKRYSISDDSEKYIEKRIRLMEPKEWGGVIRATLNEDSESYFTYQKNIAHSLSLVLGAIVQRKVNVHGSGETFDSVYGQGLDPELHLIYEWMMARSSGGTSVGLMADVGLSQTKINGQFQYFPKKPDGTIATTPFPTELRFVTLPVSGGALFRMGLTRWLRPYVGGGVSLILFQEEKADRARVFKGKSFGLLGKGGVSFSLDEFSRQRVMSLYQEIGIKSISFNFEYQRMISLVGAVRFRVSGLYLGMMAEL